MLDRYSGFLRCGGYEQSTTPNILFGFGLGLRRSEGMVVFDVRLECDKICENYYLHCYLKLADCKW